MSIRNTTAGEKSFDLRLNTKVMLSAMQPAILKEPDESRMANAVAKHRERLKQCGYVDRNDTRDSVSTVLDWVSRVRIHQSDPEMRPPGKGVVLFGTFGTGKTKLLRSLCAYDDSARDQYGNKTGAKYAIDYVEIADVIEGFMAYHDEWYVEFKKAFSHSVLVVDEIGRERYVKHFGSDSIVPDFLEWRYKCFVQNGVTTVYATNLTSEKEFAKVYSPAIHSRLLEMCFFVPFIGEDWRAKQGAKVA